MPLFQNVTDLHAQAEVIRRRRYGMIEAVDGRFHRVLYRPFPKFVSLAEVLLFGRPYHARRSGDHCRLFFDQPLRFPNFLALKYVISASGTSAQTVYRTLEALNAIARIKRSDALLCDVFNSRITEAMLTRHGWESHCPSRWNRHFIRRFYGNYPPLASWIAIPVGRRSDVDRDFQRAVLPDGVKDPQVTP